MSKQCLSALNDDGVLLFGYYKKLKTMKKKYFVLYNDTPSKNARIEYYDSDKKYKSGFTPKRTIKIKNCFNITRRLYTKDFVILLASKEGGFGIVMDKEDEMDTWLNHLLHLQKTAETFYDFPKFDYVWQVIIQKKGIAEQHNMFGCHHVCLTNTTVTFIKFGREKNVKEKKLCKVDVLLTTIRRCGDSQCFFYMEIGRQSCLGPGELWMETEDSITAQNMHRMILSKMVSLSEVLIEPMRKRSSSATETTNLHHDSKASQSLDVANNYLYSAQNFCRDRCDSLPSRHRTLSESNNCNSKMTPNTLANRVINFNVNNASFASEESVCVDESEESMETPYMIRSPEGVIPEELVIDESHLPYMKKRADTSALALDTSDMGATSPLVKQRSGIKDSYTCGSIGDQLKLSTYYGELGSKCINAAAKETMVNRVRAFSVGSRIRNTSISSKAIPKCFNAGSVDCGTRKSMSVPFLINKNMQSTDQMGDLMEIDFSNSIGKTLNITFQRNTDQFQAWSDVFTRSCAMSNSEKSIQKSIRRSDNGYLEMKPITLDTNYVVSNANSSITNPNIHLQNQLSFEQTNPETDSTTSTHRTNDKQAISSQKCKSHLYINNKDLYTTTKSTTFVSTPFNKSSCSPTCNEKHTDDIKLRKLVNVENKKDLHYASLDLPKCSNEVNNRYGFQESLSDSNIEEVKNEYAKINFV